MNTDNASLKRVDTNAALTFMYTPIDAGWQRRGRFRNSPPVRLEPWFASPGLTVSTSRSNTRVWSHGAVKTDVRAGIVAGGIRRLARRLAQPTAWFVEGRPNDAVVALLTDRLAIVPSSITVASGNELPFKVVARDGRRQRDPGRVSNRNA